MNATFNESYCYIVMLRPVAGLFIWVHVASFRLSACSLIRSLLIFKLIYKIDLPFAGHLGGACDTN